MADEAKIIGNEAESSSTETNPIILRLQREERAERSHLEAQIKSATEQISAAVSAPFAEAKEDVQAKAEKLQALKAKLGELPKEIEKLDAEAERLNAELEPAIESGASLTKLTKDLSAIRAKKEEVEVMQEVLATKLIPKAEATLAGAKKALEETVIEIVGGVLEAKRLETMEVIQNLNDELKGFGYAVDDTCKLVGMNLHGKLSHLRFSIGVL